MTMAQATKRQGTWRWILGSGLLLWVLSAFVTAITANLILVPTLVMVGSLESAGYALVASLTVHGLSLPDLVETELLRGLLSPFGHGVWTAILGAVLLSTAGRAGFRMTGRLVGAYLGVSILHGLWDSSDSIAVTMTYLLTGRTWRYRLLEEGYVPEPTAIQAQVFTILSWTGLIVIAAAGVVFLVLLLRRRAAGHV